MYEEVEHTDVPNQDDMLLKLSEIMENRVALLALTEERIAKQQAIRAMLLGGESPVNGARKRGRPAKAAPAEGKRRGRPPGSKNKPKGEGA